MRRSSVMRLMGAMGALLVVVGIATAVSLVGVPVWRARASLDWVETRCHIQRDEVERYKKVKRAIVEYTYEAMGSQRSADRVDFRPRGWSTFAGRAGYDVGTEVPCWYDPSDPDAVTLSRKVPATLILIFPLLFGAGGFLFVRVGGRGVRDDAVGTRGADGRWIYVRRGSTPGIMAAIAAIWLVIAAIFILAMAVAEPMLVKVLGAAAAVATWVLVHELRCLACRVAVVIPSRVHGHDTARVDWQIHSRLGNPHAIVSLVAIATTSKTTRTMLTWSHEATIEEVCAIPIAQGSRSGSGELCVPAEAPTSTRERRIGWFVEVHVHLRLDTGMAVRVPIEL